MKRIFTLVLITLLVLSSCDSTVSEKIETDSLGAPLLTDDVTPDLGSVLDHVYRVTEMDVPDYLYEIPADIPAGYEEYYSVDIRPQYIPSLGKTMILQGYGGDLHVLSYSDPTGAYSDTLIKTTSKLSAENVNYTQSIDSAYLASGNLLRYMSVTFNDTDSKGRLISHPVLFIQTPDGTILSEKVLDDDEFDTTAKLYVLSDGNIVVLEAYGLRVFSPELEDMFSLDCAHAAEQNQPLGDLVEASDGTIYITSQFNSTVYIFDAVGKTIKLKSESISGKSAKVGSDGNVYYIDRTGISLGDELILDWRNSSLSVDSVTVTDIIDRDTILIQLNDVFEDMPIPACLTRVPDEENTPKAIIRLAVVGLGANTQLLDGALACFNRAQTDYHVTVTDFTAQADPNRKTTAKELFDRAIADGETFDMVFLDNAMIDELSIYTNKDYFIDLSAYLEAELIQSVKSAFSVSDELYHVPVCFRVSTLASVGGAVSGNLTPDALDKLTESASDGKTLANASFIDLAVSLYDFVDDGTQTCDFENTEFRKIMELSQNSSALISKDIGQITSTSANVSAIGKAVESGDLSLLALRMDTLDVFAAAKLFTGTNLTLCGYPSAKYNGSVCGVDFTVGIVSESKVKAGAMKFLETLLSDDVQTSQLIQDSGFPVTEAGIDALLEYDEYYISITSKGGKTDSITILRYQNPLPTEPVPHPYAGLPHVSLDDDDKAELRRLLCDCEWPPVTDAVLQEIVSEEYIQYVSGDITVEEAAKRMKSRASIYLSERYR